MSRTCPCALAVGIRTAGRACLVVRGDCQKIISRPRAWAMTNCDRFSLALVSTRSIAGPRRTTGPHREPFDDLGVRRPALGAVAVDLLLPRPGLLGLDHDSGGSERDPHQKWQRRVGSGLRAISRSSGTAARSAQKPQHGSRAAEFRGDHRDPAEHTVDELRRVVGGQQLGGVDRLVHHHGRRHVERVQQLVDARSAGSPGRPRASVPASSPGSARRAACRSGAGVSTTPRTIDSAYSPIGA